MKPSTAFLLLLSIFLNSATSTNKRRIFYGEKVKTKQPFVVSLLYDQGEDSNWIRTKQFFGRNSDWYQHLCGGLIFSDYYVLTAAHCITRGGDNLHLVGVDGLNIRQMALYHQIKEKIAHPDYTDNKRDGSFIYDNDIGLVKTLSRIGKVDPPTRYNPSYDYIWHHPIILYGWGLTENGKASDHLKQIKLQFATDISVCKDAPAVRAGRVLCFRVPNEGGRAGKGDSGSPIMVNRVKASEKNVILSLQSATVELTEKKDKKFFSVHGPNLTYYYDWLVETAK